MVKTIYDEIVDAVDALKSNTAPLFVEETLDTVVDKITPGTSRSANVDWFVADSSFDDELNVVSRASLCRCDFIFEDNDAKISFTFDGTNYGFLFEGELLKAGSLYSINFGGENGNAFNIKASQNVTIQRCIICVEGKQ